MKRFLFRDKDRVHPGWLIALAAAVVALPFVYMKGMAGDAVIHLVFAEHALHGDWLSFNPGEHTGGETSLGYLLLVLGLWRVLGQSAVPYAMVALGCLAWFAMLFCGWRLVRAWRLPPVWSWVWLGLTGLMPGSVFNSVLGMENVLLAALVMGLLDWLHASHALVRRLPWRTEVAMAVFLGALTWLRPEALPLALLLLGWRFLALGVNVGWRRSLLNQACLTLVVAALFLLLVAVHLRLSGLKPFSGGVARLNMAASQGIMIGGILPLHGRMALRLAAYLPLAIFFGLGAWRWREAGWLVHRGIIGLAVAWVVGFTILFSTVLPTAQLARYTIFFWPLMALVAAYGLAASAQGSGRPERIAAALLGGVLFGVYAAEGTVRWRMLRSQHALSAVAQAAEHRRAATDGLLAELQYAGGRAVSVGLGEVQMRYFFDRRVVVRTMDGIVDNLFNSFVRRTARGVVYDYTGYLRARRVDYVLEYLNLSGTSTDWSPAALQALPPGAVVERDGVRFERLPGRVTRVTYPGEAQPPPRLNRAGGAP